MKKALAIIALAIICLGFVQDQPKLKAELTIQEWEVVLQIIKQSNAPHNQVKAVQELLIKQLQSQIKQDTTKKK